MEPKDTKRVYLYFNEDDPEQKLTYEYIEKLGRKKTECLTKIINNFLKARTYQSSEQLTNLSNNEAKRLVDMQAVPAIESNLNDVLSGLFKIASITGQQTSPPVSVSETMPTLVQGLPKVETNPVETFPVHTPIQEPVSTSEFENNFDDEEDDDVLAAMNMFAQ